ncbi:hypothetical protein EIN_084900 [Entamoeba invadens IP1]|uniref:hypothetical protein n=1 Tax=Entamoeba invadens IP1 TaxID=370355 RepID=UPI0002C3DE60|nr:hypothetical protein EIN_084900 [Entamoeba invadens IP1]ELP85278.1 hypothetical protein EIN_084900 [Entamoeba invadens IP1]|eukprot:XP_004184624.1 hypothetical protein EIN_084900 [Entamoeba invadens IP1]
MSHKLDSYSLMIVSKYFRTIYDFINAEFVCKKFQGNMEKFHYNPITLLKETRQYFPNIETLYIYERNHYRFTDGKIAGYVVWYQVDYDISLIEEKNNCICKNISYSHHNQLIHDKLPVNISNIEFKCFCDSSISSIEIPLQVTKLGIFSFLRCSNLTSVQMGNAVTEISESCFSFCVVLKTITLSQRLLTLGNNAFSHCYNLPTIQLPNSLNNIGTYTFNYCTQLSSIDIPQLLTQIPCRCFDHCISLSSVVLPPNCSLICPYAFSTCSNLVSINLKDVKTVEENAFFGSLQFTIQ